MRGSRFTAFLPFGNRASLDYAIAYLGQKTGFTFQCIMAMPSSRRHRIVKLYEEMDRQERAAQKQGQTMRRPVMGSRRR